MVFVTKQEIRGGGGGGGSCIFIQWVAYINPHGFCNQARNWGGGGGGGEKNLLAQFSFCK